MPKAKVALGKTIPAKSSSAFEVPDIITRRRLEEK